MPHQNPGIEKAHFIDGPHGEGSSYWRSWGIASNGSTICGTGLTAEQAEAESQKNLDKVEEFLKLSSIEQLKVLVSNPNMLSSDQQKTIKVLAQMVLDQEKRLRVLESHAVFDESYYNPCGN